MILRPCNKCVVSPVCEDPCPQVRKRKDIFSNICSISIGSIVASALSIFIIAMAEAIKGGDNISNRIYVGISINLLVCFAIGRYAAEKVTKSTDKFHKLRTKPTPNLPMA